MRIHRQMAVGAVALALLAGCTPSDPTAGPSPTRSDSPAAPTPEPSASATPGPAVTLVFGGAALTALDADGVEVAALPLDGDAQSMLQGLESVLGPAVPDDVEYCEFYRWGGAEQGVTLAVFGVDARPGFNVRTSASTVNGVRLRSTAGFGVGDDISAYLVDHPATEVGSVEYDPSPFDDELGAVAFVDGSTVYLQLTPTPALTTGEYCS